MMTTWKVLEVLFCLHLLITENIARAQQFGIVPQVKDVSAMCTADGITASITFDRPFSGLIYSVDHANVHECVYYNAILSQSVLFSIPTHGCGTQITHNTHEVLETVENRVYVQMDKLTQTFADRQYSFVCQQAYVSYSPIHGNEIRRHPVNSKSTYHSELGRPVMPIKDTELSSIVNHHDNYPVRVSPGHDWEYNQIIPETNIHIRPPHGNERHFHETASSSNTQYGTRLSSSMENVIDDFGVATSHTVDSDLLEPITQPSTPHPFKIPLSAPKPAHSIDTLPLQKDNRITAYQQYKSLNDSVRMEIQRGAGPYGPIVQGSVEIGELMTLVAKDLSKFSMFVHSCYASDEHNTVRVELIDDHGCSAHSMVMEPMRRVRTDEGQIIYYFPFKAFRFPNDKDVFFYCSVDLSTDRSLPQLCPIGHRKRSVIRPASENEHFEVKIMDNVTIEQRHSMERIQGKSALLYEEREEPQTLSNILIGCCVMMVGLASAAVILIFLRPRKDP